MKLTLTKVGRMPDPHRHVSALVDWLRAALEQAKYSSSAAGRTVRFGARDLEIYASSTETLATYTSGLYAVSSRFTAFGTATGASLFIAAPHESVPMPSLEGLTFGPYGAIVSDTGAILRALDRAGDSWLATINIAKGTVLALEVSSRSAIFSMAVPLAPREIAEFARPLLHWLAILDGNVVVHAGAVADEQSGLLVVGAGNSGKTTFVGVCMESGMAFLGDNVVEVSSLESSIAPKLNGAYASLKIRPNSPVRLTDQMCSTLWDDEAQKAVHILHQTPESTSLVSPELKSVLVVGSRFPEVPMPISKSEAYFAIAPNTVAQFPYFEREVLTRVHKVIRQAQTYSIGHVDTMAIPALAKKLLQ